MVCLYVVCSFENRAGLEAAWLALGLTFADAAPPTTHSQSQLSAVGLVIASMPPQFDEFDY